MKTCAPRGPISGLSLAVIGATAFLASGCLVSPPREHHPAQSGVVRAHSPLTAERIAEAFDRLLPQVLELIPDSRRRDLEVWVQDVPALYEFQSSAYSDADGFYAQGAGRIHLRDGSDHIERTLAHELVHAALGRSWDTLPGTLEEGLCDYVSAQLCPDSAARLAAGRLASAAFATGGLVLEIDLAQPSELRPDQHDVCWSARLRLEGEPRITVDPMRVFDFEAGLSSSDLTPSQKKAYYGIAFLIVQRIADSIGIEGLHQMCVVAREQGLQQVPAERLLEAAGLGLDRAGLRAAIQAAFTPREIEEIVRAHPEFLATTVAHYLGPVGLEPEALDELLTMEAFIAVDGPGRRGLALSSLEPFRTEVERALKLGSPRLAGH